MKALILRGKYKGEVCEVSQWCNDWFMLDGRENGNLKGFQRMEILRKPFSPTSLLFTREGYNEIRRHKNNGSLFDWFHAQEDAKHSCLIKGELFAVGFKKNIFSFSVS